MKPDVIQIDFLQDWAEFLSWQLSRVGCDIESMDDPIEVAKLYFNQIKRRILPYPRKVLFPKNFNCPEEFRPVVNTIASMAERGRNLTCFLSRSIDKNPGFNDLMLNNWDIHHLHLNLSRDKDGYVARSKELLFVRVTNSNFYVIAIMKHGDWALRKSIEIIHENWPDSIEQFRLNYVLSSIDSISDEDRMELWKAGISSPVDLGQGKVYIPPGMGIATTGISTEVMMKVNQSASNINRLQKWVIDNIELVLDGIENSGYVVDEIPRFRLVMKDREGYAHELTSNVAIRLPEIV